MKTIDMSIEFCGFHCENPFLLSSSCIAGNEEMVARALDMGWAGVVFKTIGFYIPDEVSPRFDTIQKEGASFVGFRNLEQISDHPLEENLTVLKHLKERFPNKLIIASIMGETPEEWKKLAALAEAAGVDMIECNFSCPQMVKGDMGADVGVNEALVRTFCQAVRKGTTLPVLAKMTPNITDMLIPAKAAIDGGATALAAINTVKSITSVQDNLFIQPSVAGKSSVSGYSGKAVKPIALRFLSDMASCPSLQHIPLSGMGGVETWHDALEFLLLGASTVQVTTSVMQYGYRIIEDLLDGLAMYMKQNHISHIQELIGKSLPNLVTSDKLNRHTIAYPKWNMEHCVGCGRCYVSCQDGGHQAIQWQPIKRIPSLIMNKCVGCQLCCLVCPTDAIHGGIRVEKETQQLIS